MRPTIRPPTHKSCLPALLLFTQSLFFLCCVSEAGEVGKPPDDKPQSPKHKHTNRLIDETSPYLLQHAHNPVDWYPWGEAAFKLARENNKPVLLSVGYSACHWCHVMEHESFEDEEVAKVLNEKFVCIKVDREERPDIDDLYMAYIHTVAKGHGGWPMTIIMTPKGIPFMGGTYYPKAQFMKMVLHFSDLWKNSRGQVDRYCEEIIEVLKRNANIEYQTPTRALTAETVTRAVKELNESYFDHENGSYPGRQKFPPHSTLRLLLGILEKDPSHEKAQKMVRLTLDKMQRGGIHDHLGGGFHRYTVDAIWLVPHFEKMLYDNAGLASNYARAAKIFKNKSYAQTARDIFEWVLRDMTSKAGAFYSSYDADSDGEEGKFYVWSRKEIENILGADAALFCDVYQIKADGNFQDEASGRDTGMNIPHRKESLSVLAQAHKEPLESFLLKLSGLKKKLLEARRKRVWPGLDDKSLLSWNALMISALATGSQDLNEPRYREAAVRAADWALAHLKTPQGRWLATFNKDKAKWAAYLDDHAFLAEAFLDLYQATGEERWLSETEKIIALMARHFWDTERGGYFFVADDHENLLVRMKNPGDRAIPSGNGIASQALIRLASITKKQEYQERAKALFQSFHTLLDLSPLQAASMLLGLSKYFDNGGTPIEIPSPGFTGQQGPVSAKLLVGHDKIKPGTKLPIAIQLSIRDGWHIQAPIPNHENLIATSVSVYAPIWGKLTDLKFPEAQDLPVDPSLELGNSIKVLSGALVIGGFLQIRDDFKEKDLNLGVTVQFQACNDKTCDAPRKINLELRVTVGSATDEISNINHKIFENLNLVK